MKKILISKVVIMILITIFLMFLAVIATLNIYNRQMARDDIATTIRMFENILIDENINSVEDYERFVSMKNVTSNLRITIMSADGIVLADSRIRNMAGLGLDNQAAKPEIIMAKKSRGDIAYCIRHSDIHSFNFLYGAKFVAVDNADIILRVSLPLSYINRYIAGFSIAIIMIMALLLIILITFFLPKFIVSVLKPFEMMKNNLESILENNFYYTKSITKYDEINSVLEEINEVSHKLKTNIRENEREKHKLNYVLENINQGLIALDENSHIVFINAFTLKLLNVTDNDYKFLIEIIRDNRTVEEIQKAIKDRKYITFEYSPASLPTNAILKIEVVPVYEGLHSLIKISDITEIKKLEIEKNELFVNASHKLNTPLTSILGYSDILLLNAGKPDNKNIATDTFITRINEQAKKMKNLISDMLQLTKYQKSSSLYDESSKEIVNLKAEIENIVDEMSIVAKSKNVQISVDAESDTNIFANKKYIEDALENLLDNAIKYNKENGSVSIFAKNIDDKIILTISDKGIGIPQEYTSRIFERFFRVSNESTKNIDGTGIGLSIVRYVCMSCNASLSVDSIENVGTDITIEFLQAN